MVNNQKGFSIIQIMVGFGLAGVLSLVILNLTQQTTKATKLAEVKNAEIQIWNQVASFVNSNDTCSNAFVGFRPGSKFDILEVTANGGGLRLEKDFELGNSGIITTEMSLLADPAPIGSNGEYYLTFELSGKRKPGDYFQAGTTRKKTFNFRAQLCEPSVTIYRNPFEYSVAKADCDTQGGTNFYWYEPAEANPTSGAFVCYICGPDKSVFGCTN